MYKIEKVPREGGREGRRRITGYNPAATERRAHNYVLFPTYLPPSLPPSQPLNKPKLEDLVQPQYVEYINALHYKIVFQIIDAVSFPSFPPSLPPSPPPLPLSLLHLFTRPCFLLPSLSLSLPPAEHSFLSTRPSSFIAPPPFPPSLPPSLPPSCRPTSWASSPSSPSPSPGSPSS